LYDFSVCQFSLKQKTLFIYNMLLISLLADCHIRIWYVYDSIHRLFISNKLPTEKVSEFCWLKLQHQPNSDRECVRIRLVLQLSCKKYYVTIQLWHKLLSLFLNDVFSLNVFMIRLFVLISLFNLTVHQLRWYHVYILKVKC